MHFTCTNIQLKCTTVMNFHTSTCCTLGYRRHLSLGCLALCTAGSLSRARIAVFYHEDSQTIKMNQFSEDVKVYLLVFLFLRQEKMRHECVHTCHNTLQ